MSDKNNIQNKLNALGELVEWFSSSDFKLDTALEKYKQAEALAEEIEKDLKTLKNDIRLISKKFDQEA